MIHPIITVDSPRADILHKPSAEVTEFDGDLMDLINDLWDTMYHVEGVGLAAPQIGIPVQVAVIDTRRSENSNRNLVLINPRIYFIEGENEGEEGCLSMPGDFRPVTRPWEVRVVSRDVRGLSCIHRGEALLARALMHEIEHLQGRLCHDHLPPRQPPAPIAA